MTVAQAKLEAERTLHARGIIGTLQLAETGAAFEVAKQASSHEQQRLVRARHTATARRAAAESRAQLAADAVEAAKAQLAGLVVTAPLSGSVAQLGAKLGQSVTAGQPLLELLGGGFHLAIRIPEAQAEDIAMGQTVDVTAPNGTLQATIAQVAAAAEGGMITALATLHDAPSWLRANQSFEARIAVGSTGGALHVVPPVGATSNASSTAWVVAADSDEAVRTTIRWGRVTPDVAIVQSGAGLGDAVLAFPPRGYESQERFRVKR
jgi:HlyD family secretion protein